MCESIAQANLVGSVPFVQIQKIEIQFPFILKSLELKTSNIHEWETTMTTRNSVIAIAVLTLALSAPAFSAESIVGTWDNDDCARPMVIGQLSLQANDTICRFDTVKRKGNRVTWKGDCDGKRSTVVAELSDGELSVDISGGENFNGLKRCDRTGGEEEQANDIPSFLKNNLRYNESLRKKMRNAGWDAEGTNLRQDGDCDSEVDNRCEAFPEALTCSGSGAAFCNMVWINDGRIVTITTSGEDESLMRITRVKSGTP
jgi:hypothetical protein